MTTPSFHKDFGQYVSDHFNALEPQTITAGGGNDDSAINGNNIDRFTNEAIALSGFVVVPHTVSLAASETAQISFKVQHADDDGNGAPDTWSDFNDKDGNTNISVTQDADGSYSLKSDYDFTGAKQWLRVVVTVTMSNTTSDTADVASSLILGPSAHPGD